MHRALLDLALPMFILACLPAGVILYEERTTLHAEVADFHAPNKWVLGGAAREGALVPTPDGLAAMYAVAGTEGNHAMTETRTGLPVKGYEPEIGHGPYSVLVTEGKDGPRLWIAYPEGKPGDQTVEAFTGPSLDQLTSLNFRTRNCYSILNRMRGSFCALDDGALLVLECNNTSCLGAPSARVQYLWPIYYGSDQNSPERLDDVVLDNHVATAPIDAITLSNGDAVLVALPVESRTSDGERSGEVISYRISRGTPAVPLTGILPSDLGTTYGTPQLARANNSYFALVPYESWTTHRGRSFKHQGQVLASKPDGQRTWKNVSSRLPVDVATKATNVRLAADGNSLTFAYTLPDAGRDTPSYHWLAVTTSHDAGRSWSSIKRVKDSAPFAVGTVPVDLVLDNGQATLLYQSVVATPDDPLLYAMHTATWDL